MRIRRRRVLFKVLGFIRGSSIDVVRFLIFVWFCIIRKKVMEEFFRCY